MENIHPQVVSTPNERQWAALAHAGALALALLTSWTAGFAGMLAAIAVYLLKKDESAFIAEHAREAFNFNLSMFLYMCAVCIAGALLIGATVLTLGIGIILTLPTGLILLAVAAAVAVAWLVCSIIATVKAWNGESYRYPLTIRLL
ncbi:MAG: DUF4870 domain-containing protein [Luteimonas sp.]|nr:DUF4870 domain-containing protein [Luteimonas sp.]